MQMLPTDNDDVKPTEMADEIISKELPDSSQHERNLAAVKRDREKRLKELEDEYQAHHTKHPNPMPDQTWDPVKLNELEHLRQMKADNEL